MYLFYHLNMNLAITGKCRKYTLLQKKRNLQVMPQHILDAHNKKIESGKDQSVKKRNEAHAPIIKSI